MRCIGAADGHSCARCLRTGRRCVVQPSRRGQQQSANSLRKKRPVVLSSSEPSSLRDDQAATRTATSSPAAWSPMIHPTLHETSSFQSPHMRIEAHSSPASIPRWEPNASSRLPSLYTSSPLDVLGSLVSQQPSKEISFQHLLSINSTSIRSPRLADIPEDVLIEYIEL